MRVLKVLVFLFFLPIIAYSQNNNSFKTPEQLMQYFVNNLKAGNFNSVFHTSPYYNDSFINKINSREMLNYMGINTFQLDPNIPFQYNMITKYNLLGKYSAGLKRFLFSLLLNEDFPELVNLKYVNIDDALLDKYFSLLDIRNLQKLEIIRMDIYLPEIQFSERGKNNTKRQYVNIFGCDDKIEYTVLYKNNGIYYIGGIIVVRYGEDWYIDSLKW